MLPARSWFVQVSDTVVLMSCGTQSGGCGVGCGLWCGCGLSSFVPGFCTEDCKLVVR